MFRSQSALLKHLARCAIDIFDTALLRVMREARIWGAIRHHGLLRTTVIVSDGAGQFRIPNHALCWVHSRTSRSQADAGNAETSRAS